MTVESLWITIALKSSATSLQSDLDIPSIASAFSVQSRYTFFVAARISADPPRISGSGSTQGRAGFGLIGRG
jgi:hypothetical protein